MKAIIGGKIILSDRVAEGLALLFDQKIEGICLKTSCPRA
jgi:hypothetical protein